MAAFATTFIAAAIVFRAAFVANEDRETATRLQVLARAGLRSAIFMGNRLAIDKADISNAYLLEQDQGLQWFDRHGRRVGSEGLTPDVNIRPSDEARQILAGGRRFNTVAIPILNPKTGERFGFVRAFEWTKDKEEDIRLLDTGLFVGTLLAIFGCGVGGLALAHRAVRPVAQSFQTLRAFTADASHELRSPLMAIMSNADAALRDEERDPHRDRTRFEAIADGARQMSRLTSDLLLLAGAGRSLEHELYVVDLTALVNKLARLYRERFAAAGIALNLAVEEGAIAYGNPDQIERVLANLIENALRYTPSGGAVSIETSRDRAYLLVTVRDTGIGIAGEHLERVFDRFWRADPARSRGGSGLGLAIARALARRHGGDVSVTSRPGVGSAFVASFPTRPAHLR